MGPHILAVDEDVIKENQYKFLELGLEEVIHKGLEDCRHVRQAKRHYLKLVVPFVSPECSFGHIFGICANLIIPQLKLQLGEDVHAVELV